MATFSTELTKDMVSKVERQDEVIDLIACEISRDSKHKSDLLIKME